MAFKKGYDPNRNYGGRPEGSRNKSNPMGEIARAIASGTTLQGIVKLISQRIEQAAELQLTEAALQKWVDMYMKYNLELIKLEKALGEGSDGKKDKPKQSAEIKPFTFKKESNG